MGMALMTVRRSKKATSLPRLLVTACPRSGTRYTTQILQNVGVGVCHESMGRNGTVCSFHAVDDFHSPCGRAHKERRSIKKFDLVWHQVRHPLRVVESIETQMSTAWWHWQEKHTGASLDERPFERSAHFWFRWNEIIENDPEVSLRYRLEAIEDSWPVMMLQLGLSEKTRMPVGVSKIMGCIKNPDRREVVWDDLGEWAEPVRLKAKEYGYEV